MHVLTPIRKPRIPLRSERTRCIDRHDESIGAYLILLINLFVLSASCIERYIIHGGRSERWALVASQFSDLPGIGILVRGDASGGRP